MTKTYMPVTHISREAFDEAINEMFKERQGIVEGALLASNLAFAELLNRKLFGPRLPKAPEPGQSQEALQPTRLMQH